MFVWAVRTLTRKGKFKLNGEREKQGSVSVWLGSKIRKECKKKGDNNNATCWLSG